MNQSLPLLTPLRGIAALMVVLFHARLLLFPQWMESIAGHTQLIENGYLWVDLFFILSGLVLAHVYGEAFARTQGERLSIVRWNPKGPSYMHSGTFASSVVEEMGLTRPTHQIGDKTPHSPALSLESLNLLDGDWLVIGTLSASGDAVDAMKQAEQTPAFQQLGAIKSKRFGAVDGSLWTSTGGPQAALKVIDDVEQLLAKPDAAPITQ